MITGISVSTGERATRLDIGRLKDAAHNQWPAILRAAGIGPAHLTGRHGPCPVCGGRDRFRFTDREGRGCFVCNAHRPEGGDGFHLLADWLQSDFMGAARFVADWLGGTGVEAVVPDAAELARRKALEEAEQQRQWARARDANLALWRAAAPLHHGCAGGRYLAGRGLTLDHYPATLRLHTAVPYWHEGRQLGVYPALLAAVQSPAGAAVALHKTCLTPDGNKADVPSVKKWSSPAGSTRGAAVRLITPDHRLCLAEGLETALAVHCANGMPVWSGLSAHGMAHAWIPPEVTEVFVFADHDPAGEQAAETLAGRMATEGREVRVLTPDTPGADWLDVFTGGAHGQ